MTQVTVCVCVVVQLLSALQHNNGVEGGLTQVLDTSLTPPQVCLSGPSHTCTAAPTILNKRKKREEESKALEAFRWGGAPAGGSFTARANTRSCQSN